jgi:SAM-dependent MidA family methyltransferase
MFAMPDPDLSPTREAATRRRSYPTPPAAATPSLAASLREEIAANGPLAFADFMAAALYDPQRGYYARGPGQTGRGGDFFTSVSVGPLFGRLLARRFLREWASLGKPGKWRVLECGAHDGALARDILEEISRLDSAAFAALEYAISEPLPALRGAQQATLAAFSGNLAWTESAADLAPLPGAAIGNEVLDALPFHVVEWRGGAWRECRVALAADGGFVWEVREETENSELQAALAEISGPFAEGTRAEVRTNFRSFLAPLARCISSGLLLWADYGFARPELYAPARREGTLRTFSRHRAAADPLDRPGEIDITAHVDFTAAAEAGIALGWVPAEFRSQGAWLTDLARDWLLAQEGNPDAAALRQFRTLTHPGHLGGSFHFLELSKRPHSPAPDPATRHRLALGAD